MKHGDKFQVAEWKASGGRALTLAHTIRDRQCENWTESVLDRIDDQDLAAAYVNGWHPYAPDDAVAKRERQTAAYVSALRLMPDRLLDLIVRRKTLRERSDGDDEKSPRPNKRPRASTTPMASLVRNHQVTGHGRRSKNGPRPYKSHGHTPQAGPAI